VSAPSYMGAPRDFKPFGRHAVPDSVTDEELRRMPERRCDVCGYRGSGLEAVGLRDLDTGERLRGHACVRCRDDA
jgi:hypothetical protein